MTHLFDLRRPRRLLLALAVSLCPLLAAAAPAGAAALPTLSVSISKGGIAVSGATTSGAVNVVTTAARGLKEPSAVLFLLKPGVSFAEFQAFVNSKQFADPDNAAKLGTIVFDNEGAPGGTTEAQTVLAPGNYVALNAEGEQPHNPPMSTFTVTAAPAPAALQAPQAVEKTIDFGFKGPGTLHDGELVRFQNEGFLVHMMIAFPTRSFHSARKLAAAMLAGRERAAFKLVSGAPFGFFGPLSSGSFQQEIVTARPGWYVLACFMDTQDGRVHTRLGMERVIHVVK